MAGDRRRLRGADRRLLKGYAPLVVLVAALVVMVAVVPSKVPAELAATGQGEATEVASGEPATGWDDDGHRLPRPPLQVPDLGYSPPCFAFTGDNGGETSRGVTADTIKVTYRVTSDPNLLLLLGQLGGVPLDESNEEMYRTMEALVEWVNANFQFYGRQIELVRYDGRGQILPEFTGGGQDAAANDSIKVANEIGAFADITGITQPYADALAAQRGRRRRGAVHVARVVRGASTVRLEHRARLHDHRPRRRRSTPTAGCSAARPTTPATTSPARSARWR